MFIPLSPSGHHSQVLRNFGAQHDLDLPITFAFGLNSGSKKWRKNWNVCMNSEYDRLMGLSCHQPYHLARVV
ncbi:hypothetical protein N7447_009682 [Penicillium robsamsonii]|uniref:uncharacterized protein n=1 Tax=Penicillium robsamsonii TaxID=1792511 RepID=UPI002546C674|nr:uncharacterized protein N7447_009682 [Penicillium robsamsonii]KAJ5817449.1 hypothetical protein N7447_009682 [Penicillium robsamsonii]